MLTIFRHIRSSLIENRAFNKYFFYAAGEIALVVIGILIALQINNWNEERAKRKQTHTYLVNLRSAIEEDIYQLHVVQRINTFREKSCTYILRIGGHAQPWSEPIAYADSNSLWNESYPDTFNREIFDLWLLYSSRARIMTVNTSAIEELKSTGMFSNIPDPDLKSMIQEYYRRMDWHFSNWREENTRNRLDGWVNFLVRKHHFLPEDFENIKDPLKLIQEDAELIAHVKELKTDAGWRCNGASRLIDAGTELIGLLPME